MDFFDILLAKKLENDKDVSIVQLNVSENGTYSESGKAYSPVVVDVQPPSNSYLRTPIDSYPTTAEQLPIPKCDVKIANQKSCKVFVSNKPFVNDKVPYIYRKSAGGDRVYEKLIGGTIAWNQLCPIRSDFSGNGITLTNNSDGSYNVNGTAEAGMAITFGSTFTVYQNHKYYIKGCPSDGGSNKYYFGLAGYVSETGSGAIFNYPSATSKQNARLDIKSGANISNAKIIPQVIDLTQMFGSTIADYIYSLEQATAGAGVAWFRTLFPNDYYAYDSGSLQSVNVASKKVYDSNNTLVATYTFDSDVTLRGLPKLDINNNLYYDGDTYESDGTVTRRYGIVDLGSLNWVKFLDQVGVFASTSDVDNMYVSGSNAVEVPIKCGKYVSGLSANELFDDDNLDNSIAANGVYPRFIVRDTSKNSLNATEFAAAMVGVYVLYPLATQTSENADPFINPQIVDADGTEEFVDYAYSQSTRDVAVPVGHDSLYYNGQLYQTDFAQAITDTINMAELHSIVPPSGEFYITSNGTLSVDVWKK